MSFLVASLQCASFAIRAVNRSWRLQIGVNVRAAGKGKLGLSGPRRKEVPVTPSQQQKESKDVSRSPIVVIRKRKRTLERTGVRSDIFSRALTASPNESATHEVSFRTNK